MAGGRVNHDPSLEPIQLREVCPGAPAMLGFLVSFEFQFSVFYTGDAKHTKGVDESSLAKRLQEAETENTRLKKSLLGSISLPVSRNFALYERYVAEQLASM